MDNEYTGNWIALEDDFEFVVGDLVMLETLDGVIVEAVHKIDSAGTLWHYNKWIISRDQIVAIKERTSVVGSEA